MLIARVRAFTVRWKAKELVCVSRHSFRFLLWAYWSRTHYHSIELYLSRAIWICGLTGSVRKPVRSEGGFSILGFSFNYVPSGSERPTKFLVRE